jgi:hypothetical protein
MRQALEKDAEVTVMSSNAQLVDTAGAFIVMGSVIYLIWGLISPRSAMFWAKRWGRFWIVGLAASMFMIGGGMGVYAQTGTPALMIAFGGAAIWLLARSDRLPAAASAPALPAAGSTAPPRFAAQASFADAEVAAIRDALPPEQRSEFDMLYNLHRRSWSLKGKDEVGRHNVEIAHQCAVHAARIWNLKNGPLPALATTLALAAGEQCVWKGDCQRLAYVTVHGTEYRHSRDDSTRNVRVEDASREELREIDDGNLYLTTKRLVFVGRKQNAFLDIAEIQTLLINDETDIAVGRAQGENLIYRSRDICDPFDPKLTGPFEILWGRVRG